MSKEDKKEYLRDLVEKIEVRLDKDTNDHHLDVFFQLGLVGDGIQNAENDKGYTVVEGGKEASVVMRRNARISGRKRQVKKNRGDLRMMNRLTTDQTQSVTVE